MYQKIMENCKMYQEHPQGVDLLKIDLEELIAEIQEDYRYDMEDDLNDLEREIMILEKENKKLKDKIAELETNES